MYKRQSLGCGCELRLVRHRGKKGCHLYKEGVLLETCTHKAAKDGTLVGKFPLPEFHSQGCPGPENHRKWQLYHTLKTAICFVGRFWGSGFSLPSGEASRAKLEEMIETFYPLAEEKGAKEVERVCNELWGEVRDFATPVSYTHLTLPTTPYV